MCKFLCVRVGGHECDRGGPEDNMKPWTSFSTLFETLSLLYTAVYTILASAVSTSFHLALEVLGS